MRGLETELLQLSVRDLPKDRNEKKAMTHLEEIKVKKTNQLCPKFGFRQSPYLQEIPLYLG